MDLLTAEHTDGSPTTARVVERRPTEHAPAQLTAEHAVGSVVAPDDVS